MIKICILYAVHKYFNINSGLVCPLHCMRRGLEAGSQYKHYRGRADSWWLSPARRGETAAEMQKVVATVECPASGMD